MKHACALIPHTADTLYGHIARTADIICSVFAVCNISHWHAWWTQAETDCDWCRANLNFQITRNVCVEAGRRQGRLINEHRIHFKLNLILCSSVLSLITLTGTDWFNRHDDSAFDDYTTLLLAADGADAGGGRKNKDWRMNDSPKTLDTVRWPWID